LHKMTGKKDIVEEAIEKAKPVLANLSFGAVMGYCSGVALQKVGKALALLVGIGFVGLQTAASFGYIVIDWEKVRIDVVKSVDTTSDGTVSIEDAQAYWKKLKTLLTNKIPSAGGFSLGFLYGVRYG
jgi:uncharacterized membrane protein (Fun14 family)